MSDSFPILFTVGASTRHDIVLLTPSSTLREISSKIEKTIASSPNCEGKLDKYSKNKNPHEVRGLTVRWATDSSGPKLWPNATVVTDGNVEAVLMLVQGRGGRGDVLEVATVQKDMPAEEAEKDGGAGEGEKKE